MRNECSGRGGGPGACVGTCFRHPPPNDGVSPSCITVPAAAHARHTVPKCVWCLSPYMLRRGPPHSPAHCGLPGGCPLRWGAAAPPRPLPCAGKPSLPVPASTNSSESADPEGVLGGPFSGPGTHRPWPRHSRPSAARDGYSLRSPEPESSRGPSADRWAGPGPLPPRPPRCLQTQAAGGVQPPSRELAGGLGVSRLAASCHRGGH